jgi:hypothetical protein
MLPPTDRPKSLTQLVTERRLRELETYPKMIDGYLEYLNSLENPEFSRLKEILAELIRYVAATKEITRESVTGKEVVEVKHLSEDEIIDLKVNSLEQARQNGFWSIWRELDQERLRLGKEDKPVITDEREMVFVHGDTLDLVFGALFSHEFVQ